MILSDSTFAVKTEHGNVIVYALQPQHLNETPNSTLRERCMMYGRQIAVNHAGEWFNVGMKTKIEDLRTIALLERVSDA